MIEIILTSYRTLMASIGAAALLLFLLGSWLILRTTWKMPVSDSACTDSPPPAEDLTAIAGDDVIATQLDLARAYIETGSGKLAHAILKRVMQQGGKAEQQEAQRLLSTL